ncbi:spore germination protein [Paenibacillus tarimensis]|nr:spore germination protein [Paenibacillus tarimensis]MCF2942485.1 spore germination protein [Paenibacillus tarimensis]
MADMQDGQGREHENDKPVNGIPPQEPDKHASTGTPETLIIRQHRVRMQPPAKKSKQKQDDLSIPSSLEDFRTLLKNQVGLGASFDVVIREMTFGDRKTALFFMNGFAKDTILTEVLKRLTYLQPEQVSSDAVQSFLEMYIPAIQVVKVTKQDKMLDSVLAGSSALFIEKEQAVLVIDAKSYPGRTPEEPTLERVVRGSRDGFVETLMTNISLVRRRLRDRHLRYEMVKVGRRTQTDVCIAYLDDVADLKLVDAVREKINAVEVEGIPLADKQLEEATVKRGWNPYPLVRYSERPDVVAAQLLSGNVAVFVDTSPSVMLLPTTFFEMAQHAEEDRQTPFIGTYLRWVRFAGILASMFLLPLWFLLVVEENLLPPALGFIGPTDAGRIPLLLQFLLVEIGVDLLRMAAVHTPTPLATAMSLISAILIGDIAVKTGLFINEVILYMAVAAIGMFATPSYELGLANRIVRLVLLILVAAFRIPGFMLGCTLLIVLLAVERSFNRPYLWPFIPFNRRALGELIVRRPFLKQRKRTVLYRPK